MQSGNNEAKIIDVNLELKGEPQQPIELLSGIPDDAYISITEYIPKVEVEVVLSELCRGFYKQNKDEANKRALLKLQRAVLDDDQEMITKILEKATPQRLHYLLTTNY